MIPLLRRPKLQIVRKSKQTRVREAIAQIDKHVADLLYRARRSHVVSLEALIAQYQHDLWHVAETYTSKLEGAIDNEKLMHTQLVQTVSHLERIGESYAEKAANLGFERCLKDLVLYGYLKAYQTPVIAPKEYARPALAQNHDYLHHSLLPDLHAVLATSNDIAKVYAKFANRIKMYGHYLWRVAEEVYRNGMLDFDATFKTKLKEIGTETSGNLGHKGIPGHKGGSLPNPNSAAQKQKSAFLATGENLHHYENNPKVKELVDKKLYGAAKKEIKAFPGGPVNTKPNSEMDSLDKFVKSGGFGTASKPETSAAEFVATHKADLQAKIDQVDLSSMNLPAGMNEANKVQLQARIANLKGISINDTLNMKPPVAGNNRGIKTALSNWSGTTDSPGALGLRAAINEMQDKEATHSFSKTTLEKYNQILDAPNSGSANDMIAYRESIKANFKEFQTEQGRYFDKKYGPGTEQNATLYRGLRSREAEEVAKLNIGDSVVLPTARSYTLDRAKTTNFTNAFEGVKYIIRLQNVSGKDHVFASQAHTNGGLHIVGEREVIVMGNHNEWEVSDIHKFDAYKTYVTLKPKTIKEAQADNVKRLQLHGTAFDDDTAPVWLTGMREVGTAASGNRGHVGVIGHQGGSAPGIQSVPPFKSLNAAAQQGITTEIKDASSQAKDNSVPGMNRGIVRGLSGWSGHTNSLEAVALRQGVNEAQGFDANHSFSDKAIKKAEKMANGTMEIGGNKFPDDDQSTSIAIRMATKSGYDEFQKEQAAYFDANYGAGTKQNGEVFRGLREREATEINKLGVGDSIKLPTLRSYTLDSSLTKYFTEPVYQEGVGHIKTVLKLSSVSGKADVFAVHDHTNAEIWQSEKEVIIMGNKHDWQVAKVDDMDDFTRVVTLTPKKVKEADDHKHKTLQLHATSLTDDEAPVWLE